MTGRSVDWIAARPRVATRLRRIRVIATWAALPLLGAMLVLVPATRESVRAYAWSLAMLFVWFLLVRTKTVSWAATVRWFSACVAWSAAIGWFTLRVADELGLSPASHGSGTALAGFLEESGKLIPLLVLAVLAPGRVRRFGAGDWALLGFASGAAFNAYEDAMRQIAVQRTWFQLGDPSRAYSWNPWASGQFVTFDGVAMSPGHHIWTVTGAMGIGLGIALWRTHRVGLRVLAFALPAMLVLWQIADHASFNARNYESSWPAEPAPGFPTFLSGLWSAGGHGRLLGATSVVLLIACLLVDVRRRHRAAILAPPGPVRARPGGAVNDEEPGLAALRRWSATLAPYATHPGAQAHAARVLERSGAWLIRALAQWIADVGVVLAAHSPLADEPRRAAMVRGRTVAVRVRQIRCEAMELTTPGAEPETRRRFAVIAAVVGGAGVLLCVLWGAEMASAIGTYLRLDGDEVYLAGLLDRVGDWWSSLNGWQQVAVGAGVAALVVLSGGSFGLALGISGVATYGLSHAHGAATFTRDPIGATRSYVSTTTPMEALLDVGDFVLTFAPANFAGAAAGRGVRVLAEEIVANPRALLDRARSILRFGDDSGEATVEVLLGPTLVKTLEQRGVDPTPFRMHPAAFDDPKVVEDWVAARYTDPNGQMSKPAQGRDPSLSYQTQVAGPREIRLVTPEGEVVWADGLTIDQDKVVAVLDAKHVDKPGQSIYEGTSFFRTLEVNVDGEVMSKLEAINRSGFDKEIAKYAAVVRDPGNPIARIRIPTTTQQAVEYLSARVRSMLGEPGVDVDWEVVLQPLEGTP